MNPEAPRMLAQEAFKFPIIPFIALSFALGAFDGMLHQIVNAMKRKPEEKPKGNPELIDPFWNIMVAVLLSKMGLSKMGLSKMGLPETQMAAIVFGTVGAFNLGREISKRVIGYMSEE